MNHIQHFPINVRLPHIMLTPCLASMLTLLPIIAAIVGPGMPDMYAAFGWAPATTIVILNVVKKERTLALAVSVFCASASFGAFGPGAFVHHVLKMPFESIIWQTWMLMGFIAAILGWSLTHYLLKLGAMQSDTILRFFFGRYMPPNDRKPRP